MSDKLTPGATGFAAQCSNKHAEMLFEDRAEWVAHQKSEHRNTAGTLGYNHTRPRVSVTITAAEHEQLGRWVTGKHGPYAGKLGQVFALAPGHNRVWVSFGGSDLRDFNLGELESAAAPAHTLSLVDPEPVAAPVAAPVAPVALAPAPVAPAPAPMVTAAPEAKQATRPPRRRTPARPAAHARNGHVGPNGDEVAAYWKSIEARYLAAIA